MDGMLCMGADSMWYGQSIIIKSCARLDCTMAQNIIEDKVATGELLETMDLDL